MGKADQRHKGARMPRLGFISSPNAHRLGRWPKQIAYEALLEPRMCVLPLYFHIGLLIWGLMYLCLDELERGCSSVSDNDDSGIIDMKHCSFGG